MASYAREDTPDDGEEAENDSPRMSEEDIQRIVKDALQDAQAYVEQELSPERAKAASYYKGEPFGDEEEGRSQVVSTDVRDSIASVMPSILRVIFGPERVVEYVPKRQDAVEDAKQQTDYIFHVLETEDGFLKLHASIKDGLIGGLGGVKWWWEDGEAKKYSLTGLSQQQLLALQSDSDIDLGELKPHFKRRRLTTKIKQLMGVSPADQPLFDVEVTRYDKEGRLCFEAIPPDEIVFSRQARGPNKALLLGHKTEVSRSDLIDMGHSEEELDEAGDGFPWPSEEEVARRNDSMGEDPEAGEANEKVLYSEVYMPLDVDGDGQAELTKLCCVGSSYTLLYHEPAEAIDMAVWTPDPMPHVLQGESWSVRTMDIQSIKSHLLRAIFDSAGMSIFPRPVVEQGHVNIDDVLNNEIGALIRVDKQGAVMPFETRFVGADLVPLLAVMDDTTERRTGRNKAAAGLDADALQSTTKSAADAAIQGGLEQVEMLVRMICEQLLKPMFRGFRRLTVKHQPRKKMVRLRGKWVEINASTWDTDADVTVNVALGSTLSSQRAMNLNVILQKQEQILSMLGVSQPIVTPAQYANTLRRLTLALGEKEVDAYFSEVRPDWKPEPQPQQQDPAQVIALAQLEIEKMKTERELAIAEAELALKQKQHEEDLLVEVASKAADVALERLKLNAEFNADADNAELQRSQQAVEGFLAAEELDLREKEVGVNAALAADKQEKDAAIADKKASQPKPKKSE